MLRRIIRIAAAVGALSLWGGCVRIADLTPEEAPTGAIAFDAGSLLAIDNDATKDVAAKFQFGEGDEFFVYGAKTIGGSQEDVFDGTLVRYVSRLWGYDNTRFWDTQSSRYDFLAIAGPRSTAGIYCDPVAAGPVTAYVNYNAVLAECDLMAACTQRLSTDDGGWTDGNGNPVNLTDPVALRFHHLLSAVSVTVTNGSQGVITLQSWRFQNIAVGGEATIVQNTSGVPGLEWKHSAYSDGTAVLGSSFVEPEVLSPGELYPNPWAANPEEPLIVNMMIPQKLAQAYLEPQLLITYTYEEPDYAHPGTYVTLSRTLPLTLGTIKGKDTAVPVTAWEPGVWYEYEIGILPGGNVEVNVVTTLWDAEEAGANL